MAVCGMFLKEDRLPFQCNFVQYFALKENVPKDIEL